MKQGVLLFFLIWVGVYSGIAQGTNDHIFPGAAVSKSFIDFDPRGFLIRGKREFLVSAGLEYARMPRAQWKDRLLRLKRGGFNCVEIYTFWNWHEPREGVFDFGGDHDLDAFLRLCKEMDLYVIARVGPYYCAEWDNGGYPLWLRFKPGVEVRKDNAAFLQCVDRFFDRLLPIVAANQIHRGGSVILVQLENEHNDGWGTAMPNGYFRHLQEKALAGHVEVPYFFSGLHHASDPAGDALNFDDAKRPNPWFSTEFWSVWYNQYGPRDADAAMYERRTWKIIAHGGGGYNYYMAYGGSNFGYTNNDEDAANYDYGSAVGQAGDLRPLYYSFKRMGWFARSFQLILTNAADGTAAYVKDRVGDSVVVTARHSAAGDIEFFDNTSKKAVSLKLDGAAIGLAPGEIFPVVHDFALSPAIRLVRAPVRIYGVWGAAGKKTMIVYGHGGEHGTMVFTLNGKTRKLDVVFNDADTAVRYVLSAGQEKLTVLVMDQKLADRSYYIAETGKLVIGVGYAGAVDAETRRVLREETYARGAKAREAVLGKWQVKTVTAPAAVGFDGAGWVSSEWPLQMGSDGDGSPDAWYRTSVKVDSAGEYVLQLEGGDRATVFIDGKPVASERLVDGEIALQLSAGRHALAIFTAHDGRDKLAGFVGDMSTVDRKGLTGHPRLERGKPSSHELGGWKFLKAAGVHDIERGVPADAGTATAWTDYEIGKDVFGQKEGFGWFRTVLPPPPAGVQKGVVKFRSVDENATVFINGRRMLRHEGWNIPFQIELDGLDTLRGPLVLTVFMENYSNEGGIDRPVRVNYFKDAADVKGWVMHGGIAEPGAVAEGGPIAGWKEYAGVVDAKPAVCEPMDGKRIGIHGGTGWPTYYKNLFTVAGYGRTGDHPIWRVNTFGLGHGTVWVNGHNLGRYPEKMVTPGMYIPECWLKAGENELVIFDEDGTALSGVTVIEEPAAGRVIDIYSK